MSQERICVPARGEIVCFQFRWVNERRTKGKRKKERTVCVVIMWFRFSLWNRATPLMIMLLLSVAPEVKTMSFSSAPIRFATCYESLVSALVVHSRNYGGGGCARIRDGRGPVKGIDTSSWAFKEGE